MHRSLLVSSYTGRFPYQAILTDAHRLITITVY